MPSKLFVGRLPADADALGNEAAHSLRPELRGALTLADLRASAALEEGSGADA